MPGLWSGKRPGLRNLVQGSQIRASAPGSSAHPAQTQTVGYAPTPRHSGCAAVAVRLPAGSSSESSMSRPSAFMVSTFRPPLAGKGQILRLQREQPPLLAPPTPQGAVLVPPQHSRCIPAGTHSQTMIQRHKPTQTADTYRHMCTHGPRCKCAHTQKTYTDTQLQRCTHKRAQTYSHHVLANTEEKPKQRMKPPWQGWEALQRRLGGERGEAGQCEATVQSWNPRHGDVTTTSSPPKPCVPLHWAP